jgi:hypothetical protein
MNVREDTHVGENVRSLRGRMFIDELFVTRLRPLTGSDIIDDAKRLRNKIETILRMRQPRKGWKRKPRSAARSCSVQPGLTQAGSNVHRTFALPKKNKLYYFKLLSACSRLFC